MTGKTARDIVNEATAHAGRDRVARVAAILLALSLLVAGVYFGPRIVEQGDRIGELETSVRDSAVVATKLADQVKSLGGTPVVQPPAIPATASADLGEVRLAARTAVAEFCAAPSRPCRGADGASPNFELIVDAVVAKIPAPRDGRDAPTPDIAGFVAAYCGQANEPCRGSTGPAGESPPCLAEPAQCRGVDGRDGKDGRDGVDGQPGSTCPDGYELRDAVITAPDSSTYSGKACVDPSSSTPPSSDPPLPIPGGN
ncbi:MAG TPA: hypothetical protein VFG15_06385 [Amycolatopsis sp.]|nr:hypothetical protein [Amycolatopsis sp.]